MDEKGETPDIRRAVWLIVVAILTGSCSGPGGGNELAEDAPVHLEECLDGATVLGSKVPDSLRERDPFRESLQYQLLRRRRGEGFTEEVADR